MLFDRTTGTSTTTGLTITAHHSQNDADRLINGRVDASSGSRLSGPFSEQLPEPSLQLPIEIGVNERVQRGVAVA